MGDKLAIANSLRDGIKTSVMQTVRNATAADL